MLLFLRLFLQSIIKKLILEQFFEVDGDQNQLYVLLIFGYFKSLSLMDVFS